MENRIREAVHGALAKAGASDVAFAVEWPANAAHGDYATNAAMAAAKALGKNPKALAEELAPYIQEALGGYAASVSVAGPGFINITLSRDVFAHALTEAVKETWGKGNARADARVIVEYSCPNPFKEMHIGHLMNTVIGEAVSRVIENAGARIMRDTYGGDVGPHVAKALWALRRKGVTEVANATEVDEAYVQGARAYEESEKAKAEIDALNVELYKREDGALMNLWRKAREACLAAFREIYRELGTRFDYYFFESETAAIGMDIVRDGLARGIFTESEGAIIYDGEKKGLHTLVFVTSRGTPTYEAKELGLAFYKEERWPSDKSYILTANEQIGHFNVVKAALEEIAPVLGAKTYHIPHGMLRLTTGKMASRKGNAVTAKELMNDMAERALAKNPDPAVSEQVAVGAIKYMMLRQAPGGDIVFDPEQSLSLEGDSGPYLQYALVRARAVLEKARTSPQEPRTSAPAEPYLIERLIARFPEVAARAAKEHAPHHVAQYLTQLAGEWNAFYAKERIIGDDHEAHKLLVAKAFANTMERGLWLLGIPAPEKM